MNPRDRLAVWLDSYRNDLKSSLRNAAGDGYALIHANAAAGELRPAEFSQSGRRHLARYLRDLGLGIDALAAAFPGRGLSDVGHAERRIAELRDTLSLCAELRIGASAVPIAGFADEKSKSFAGEMLAQAAELSDHFGIRLAIQPIDDDPAVVAEHVRRAGCPTLSVALDTACLRQMPADFARTLGPPGAVYLRDVRTSGSATQEVSLGQGDIDFRAVFGNLAATGYSGPLVVRRDLSGPPVDALRQAREYVASLLPGVMLR